MPNKSQRIVYCQIHGLLNQNIKLHKTQSRWLVGKYFEQNSNKFQRCNLASSICLTKKYKGKNYSGFQKHAAFNKWRAEKRKRKNEARKRSERTLQQLEQKGRHNEVWLKMKRAQ